MLMFDGKEPLQGGLVFIMMFAMCSLVLEPPVYFMCIIPLRDTLCSRYTPCALVQGGYDGSPNLGSHLKSLQND